MTSDERGGGLAVWWGDPALSGSAASGSFVLPAGTVGFLLTDVEGSARLWQADGEAMAVAMARHAKILDAAVSAHGGVCPLAQGEGDSVVAAFARASDAVLAARDAQRALHAEPWPTPGPLRVRMAVHSGEARVVDDGNYAGQAIIRAARLRSIAHGGQVLVSAAARDLTVDQLGDTVGLIDLGEHRLKDLARPEHVYQLVDPTVPSDFPALQSLDAHAHNLPSQLSSFIGRTDEIATVATLLQTNRLVTITGSGGAGKTRLALQVTAEVIDRYPDGVWWVELAEIVDPDLIAATIAAAVGVKADVGEKAAETLAERLAGRRLLLAIDNCEHMVAGVAALVDRVLRRAAGVAVLATSREALEVAGEVAWRIPPLAVPRRGDAVAVGALSQFDAVRLFADRARRVRPNFHLSDDNAPVVAGICEQLDGIPLAIELAAARCRSLSPAQIRDGLTDAIRLLTGGGRVTLPRQQTLEASIAWSHNLLAPPEQVLLRRLSVFRGGCTLDDAEAVVADDFLARADVLDVLDRLVAQSLVQLDDDGRYTLLETVRQYGTRQLDTAAEAALVHERHANHYANVAQRFGPQLETHEDIGAFARLLADVDNIRAMLDYLAATVQWVQYAETVEHLVQLWALIAPAEGIVRLSRAIDDASLHDRLQARLLSERGFTRQVYGLMAEATHDAKRAALIADGLGDAYVSARAATILGMVVSWADPLASVELLTTAAERCHDVNDVTGEARARHFLANAYVTVRQEMDTARVLLARSRRLAEEIGSNVMLAYVLITSALGASYQGDFPSALMDADRAEAALFALVRGTSAGAYQPFRHSVASSVIHQVRVWAAVATGQPTGVVERLPAFIARARADSALGANQSLQILYAISISAAGELAAAMQQLEAVVVDAEARGSNRMAVWAKAAAANVAFGLGDPETATRHADDVIRHAEHNGPFQHLCQASTCRAALAVAAGELGKAEDIAHEALTLGHAQLFRAELIVSLELLADVAAANHSWADAARLLGAAARLRSDTGITLRLPGYREMHDRAMIDAETALGADAYAAAVEEGRALDLDAAVTYARRARGERKRPGFGWDSLTPTEHDVIDLVAAGLTNPQIGERLLIGRETVKTHLGHVFTKLGVRNRAELTALVVDHQHAVAEG